jgi:hypothetical protein
VATDAIFPDDAPRLGIGAGLGVGNGSEPQDSNRNNDDGGAPPGSAKASTDQDRCAPDSRGRSSEWTGGTEFDPEKFRSLSSGTMAMSTVSIPWFQHFRGRRNLVGMDATPRRSAGPTMAAMADHGLPWAEPFGIRKTTYNRYLIFIYDI